MDASFRYCIVRKVLRTGVAAVGRLWILVYNIIINSTKTIKVFYEGEKKKNDQYF